MFYNGRAELPERFCWRLSETFLQETERPELELAVTVFNINPGKNEGLLSSCGLLREYMQYVSKVREHLKTCGIGEAAELAADECIKENILAEFLDRNRAEAIAVSIFEYDEEAHRRSLRQEGYEEGKAEGKAEMIRLMRKAGYTCKEVARIAGLTEDEVRLAETAARREPEAAGCPRR